MYQPTAHTGIDEPLVGIAGSRAVSSGRLPMLDGWRGVSILLVLAGHMLPLGPKRWLVNGQVAGLGMAIFLCLSGFLIVSLLLKDQHVGAFLVKRIARIVPLAWLVISIVFIVESADAPNWIANLFFYANLPPFYLLHGGHLWSLSLEMQFYGAIALIVLAFGRGGLMLVVPAAAAVTLGRIYTESDMSIVTWFRVDEILAGAILAFIVRSERAAMLRRRIATLPFIVVLIGFVLSTRPELPILNYLRPYITATMIGITVLRPVRCLSPILAFSWLRYIATISYAVYILHPYSQVGWLGSGEGVRKYLKRPLCFAITFCLAHVSTYYFERPINDLAHRFAQRRFAKDSGGR